ncbi:putative PPE family protein PPE29 [Mycobacterium simulans]|uniref:PPE family protein n=1 Tax=Mycobacterium simulans TaxID=627089 RepID=UPI00174BAA88|nr:PPE family protein [Mycobacterium simulans]SON60343.1 putative PPE family protein PPE29 [Mycobacterium simulans]
MDFALLPPEITSTRIYAGPGTEPMLAAAVAWDGLTDQLYATASAYSAVIAQLTSGPWQGPASAGMAGAAAAYVAWLTTTAAQAEQTANQARAAAAAFEVALVTAVPPPLIAANRSLLISLIAANLFGQNTPAIAATELQYDEMWAQDVAVMYGYAGSSAAAMALTTFTPPPQTTNPAGLVCESAAVELATATSSSSNAYAALMQITAGLPNMLQQLTSPVISSTTYLSWLSTLSSFVSPMVTPLYGLSSVMSTLSSLTSVLKSSGTTATTIGKEVSGLGSALAGGLASGTKALAATGFTGLAAGGASAAVGQAGTIGALSVPQGWATAHDAGIPTASALSSAGLGTFGATEADALAGTGLDRAVPGLISPPPTTVAGRNASEATGATPRFDVRPTVIPRSPIGG